jgi:hypothetical protein
MSAKKRMAKGPCVQCMTRNLAPSASFNRLLDAMDERHTGELVFYAFDLLDLDGKSTRAEAYRLGLEGGHRRDRRSGYAGAAGPAITRHSPGRRCQLLPAATGAR